MHWGCGVRVRPTKEVHEFVDGKYAETPFKSIRWNSDRSNSSHTLPHSRPSSPSPSSNTRRIAIKITFLLNMFSSRKPNTENSCKFIECGICFDNNFLLLLWFYLTIQDANYPLNYSCGCIADEQTMEM